jgi:hypothetical protein
MRCVWLVALMLLLAQPATAQVYKWVDANGVTHYDERPQSNRKSKEVDLRDASPRQPGSAGAAAASPSLQARELEFRKRQVTRAEEETRSAQQKAQRDQTCQKALAALVDLRATHRLYELDTHGERVFMSDAQRDATVAKREAEYRSNCG